MDPVSQFGETNFSPCSVGNICKQPFSLSSFCLQIFLLGSVMGGVTGGRVNTTCLVDPDQARKTVSLQMCGNGIVEAGEDCDPGPGVNSSCCDVQTCKFKNGALCDPRSSPCCTEACNFAPADQICRPSRDQKCDTAEYCTGNSSACPPDITAPNGEFSSVNTVIPVHLSCSPTLSFSYERQQLWR